MLKLIGAIFIFAATTGAGMCASEMYKRRVAQLEAFVLLISHIGAEINGFLTPLDKIYANLKSTVLDKCGFLDALRKEGGVEALHSCAGALWLMPDEISELERFFSGIGQHSAAEETRHCAYFEKRMGEYAARAGAELAGKVRVCRSFGMLAGVMISLLLM